MSDDNSVEAEARLMGWVPKEEFRGSEDIWVDADSFVEKGRHITPILRKNNERLLSELGAMKEQNAKLNTAVSELTESMEALKEFHAESTKAQVARARSDILAELKAAKEEGDIDREVAAQSDLSEFDAAGKAVKAPAKKEESVTQTQEITPEFKIWNKENPWFGTDLAKTGMAQGIAQQMRNEGSALVGREFLDAVTEAVEAKLGGTKKKVDKVEGSRGGGGGGSSGGSSYADLPADARAACDKQASKFVGENKVYKTVKEWNAFYADQYFKG